MNEREKMCFPLVFLTKDIFDNVHVVNKILFFSSMFLHDQECTCFSCPDVASKFPPICVPQFLFANFQAPSQDTRVFWNGLAIRLQRRYWCLNNILVAEENSGLDAEIHHAIQNCVYPWYTILARLKQEYFMVRMLVYIVGKHLNTEPPADVDFISLRAAYRLQVQRHVRAFCMKFGRREHRLLGLELFHRKRYFRDNYLCKKEFCPTIHRHTCQGTNLTSMFTFLVRQSRRTNDQLEPYYRHPLPALFPDETLEPDNFAL